VADSNTIITATQPFTIAGALTRTEVLTFHEVIHPNGTVNIQSFGILTGAVSGIAGSVASGNVSSGDNNSQEGRLLYSIGPVLWRHCMRRACSHLLARGTHIQGRSHSDKSPVNYCQ
jgi:hypothetical protein